MSAIALENVSLSFAAKPQPFTVLEEINLTLDKGEFVVLLGRRAAANPPFSTWSPGLPNRTADAYWRAENRCAAGAGARHDLPAAESVPVAVGAG
jgi:ABC-type taurine transport system ATPase subunit